MFITDRSRVISYQTCNRKRFLSYHLSGLGIQKDSLNSNLFIGSCVHRGLEILLQEAQANISAKSFQTDLAVFKALEFFDEGIQKSPFDDEGDANFLYFEYRSLVEAMIRVYALVGLPELLKEYEILEVEKELEFWLVEPSKPFDKYRSNNFGRSEEEGILFLSRPDAILRRRSDGAILVLSYKTSATYDAKLNDLQNKYDMQGISETIAVERWLEADYEERLGKQKENPTPEGYLDTFSRPKVKGVKMEFLIKGSKVGTGQYKGQINNFLIHPYQNEKVGTGVDDLVPQYEFENEFGEKKRLGKDWRKVNIWELGDEALKEWIELLWNDNPQLLKSMVVVPDVYYRNEEDVQDWLDSTIAQEGRVAIALRNLYGIPKEIESLRLNVEFPKYRHSCFSYNSRCGFWEICWLGLSPNCADFVPRIPNHEAERNLYQIEK